MALPPNTSVAPSPQVLSVTPNGHLPGFAGDQRSRVINLTVVFDHPVDLDADALTLALHTNHVTLIGQFRARFNKALTWIV